MGLTLDELARLGAQRMLKAALEAEVSAYVAAHQEERDARAGPWWCATAMPEGGR